MRIQFLGAAGLVTGSKTLVCAGETRILVDCGMFQGFKANRMRNWDPLEVRPLDAVVLTHAHLDHSGWFPALVRQGYDGPLYCTPGTADLLAILLPDAGRIQEEDAEDANRHGSSSHTPAEPMYTEADAIAALKRIVAIPLHKPFRLGDIEATFHEAGHILGAASLQLRTATSSILFSGDLGRTDDLVVPSPEPPPAVDAVVMESTYGDRLHPEIDRLDLLAEVVNRTVQRGGMLLIPSFAVGRAQGLLWGLHCLIKEERIPRLPIVVDSPMATRATAAFLNHPEALRLSPAQLQAMTEHVQFVGSVEESKALNGRQEPFILIAASGMLVGGRVLHHLMERGPVKKNTLLFVGFQAPGTRGGRIIQGERTVKMYGRKIKLHCEVEEIGGFSAHADANDLQHWLDTAVARPKRVFLNHGEPNASDAMRLRLKDEGYDVVVATEGVIWDLERDLREVVAPQPESKRDTTQVVGLFGGAALVFEENSEEAALGVRAALRHMETGRLMRIPVVVRGTLCQRVRKLLTDDELTQVRLEP